MSPLDRRHWRLGAWLLSLSCLVAWAERLSHTGLALRIQAEDGSLIANHGHANLGTSRIDAQLAREERPLRAEWSGYWNVPSPAFTGLILKSDGEAWVELDGVAVLGIGPNQIQSHRSTQAIAPGLHRLRVVYRPGSGARREIFLKGITADARSIPVERRHTFPAEPSMSNAVMGFVVRPLFLGALLAWAGFVVFRIKGGASSDLIRKGPVVILCLVTLLAAALRFEAVVIRYWGATAPDWAEALASEIRAFRPGAFEHAPTLHPYEGDPFSYLTLARSMGGFYEPSAREPLFPFLTRLALFLAGGRDIGINFLSALCSALVCVAVFALGSRLLSAWTGVFAALLWAIEWQALSFSVEGWRDDLFTQQVAACAAAIISLHLRPGRLVALVLGIAGGLTLLTRLSALSFLVPGLIAAVLLPGSALRRERLRAAGAALLWMILLAGPFMAACAIGFGDPFYAVNVHAAFYRDRAGLPGSGGSTALRFLAQSLPWEFLQTGFVGLTSYPFSNKWLGLGALVPGLGEIVRVLALAGVPVVLWRPGGALALVVLFSAIAPYAWTWGIPGGAEWRFTLPAYPFYLVFALIAVETLIRGLVEFADRGRRREVLLSALRFVVTAALLTASFPWASRWLDWFRVREAIRHHRPALIEAGSQARRFFSAGWEEVGNAANGSMAFSMSAPEVLVRIPLSEEMGARIVLRLGASRGATSPVDVFVGDDRLVSLAGERGLGETATIDIIPFRGRKKGELELRFVGLNPKANDSPLTLLWVRVEPSPGPSP